MASPILRITDGTYSVDLLSTAAGILLDDWTPSIAPLKGGGTYQQSILSDGRQLVMANYDNAVETFSLKIHGGNQDAVIHTSQNLLRLLENARTYWFTPFQTTPVWLVARAPNETNTRYAIIHNYTQSGLDNPYAMPFFASCGEATMDNIIVSVERGHWSNVEPGNGECVAITGTSETSITYQVESVVAAADDLAATLGASGHAAVSLQTGLIFIASGRDYLPPNARRSASFRFPTVDIPDGATVTAVRLRLTAAGTSFGTPPTYRSVRIYAEDADNPAQIVSTIDWNSRVLTSEYEDSVLPFPHTAGWEYDYWVTDVFNEVRDRVGWTDGNAMIFYMDELWCDNGAQVNWAAQENTTLTEARLFIEYMTSTGVTTPTCNDEVFISDKYNHSTLTHVYLWDGAVWSANLINNATIDMAGTPVSVGDKIYFGSLDTGLNDQGPFSNVIFDVLRGRITTGGIENYVWEWWQGAPANAWKAFIPANHYDSANDFYYEDRHSLSFFQNVESGGDWVPADLNAIVPDGVPPSVTGWWIRARVNNNPGAQPTQIAGGAHSLYTVTWPNANIDATQIVGDIPAIARVKLDDSGQSGFGPMKVNRVVLALSSERGPYGGADDYNFSAFLPYPYQIPSVIEGGSLVGAEFSLVDDSSVPSGKCVQLAPVGTGVKEWDMVVNSLHFFGSYRAFLRARQIGGNDNDFTIKLQIKHWDTGTVHAETSAQPVVVQSDLLLPNWQLLDLGLVDIPSGLPARTSDEGSQIILNIHTTVAGITGDLRYMDLILMPTDEWIADIQDIGTEGYAFGYNLHVDSISVPKVDLRSLVKKGGSPLTVNPISWKTIGQRMAMPARVASKLWMLTAYWDDSDQCWLSDGRSIARVQLFTSEQYLGLRGSR